MPLLVILTTDPTVGPEFVEEAREILPVDVEVSVISMHSAPGLRRADGHLSVSSSLALPGRGRPYSPWEHARAVWFRAGIVADEALDRSGITRVWAQLSSDRESSDRYGNGLLRVSSARAKRFWSTIRRSRPAMNLIGAADAVVAREDGAVYAAWQIARLRPEVIATLGVGPAALQLEARRIEGTS